ncbi:hypothetical protein [Escherichia coli]|uniref:hypothetical protein n=1 Tax=Escherichia coli TaxID=562 RepID=UPI003B42F1AF
MKFTSKNRCTWFDNSRNNKTFTQIAIDLLPAKLSNCTQTLRAHIISLALTFMFF